MSRKTLAGWSIGSPVCLEPAQQEVGCLAGEIRVYRVPKPPYCGVTLVGFLEKRRKCVKREKVNNCISESSSAM